MIQIFCYHNGNIFLFFFCFTIHYWTDTLILPSLNPVFRILAPPLSSSHSPDSGCVGAQKITHTSTVSSSLRHFSPHHMTFSRDLYSLHSMLFSLCLPLHAHLVFVWFSLSFLSPTLDLKPYRIFSPHNQIGHTNNLEPNNNKWRGGCDLGFPLRKAGFDSLR